jgi:hypothetical protein
MPEIFRIQGYKIYFWSNESGEPVHVHISKGKPTANATKIWILSNGGILICHNKSRISKSDLSELTKIITRNNELIVQKWCDFFGDEPSYYV